MRQYVSRHKGALSLLIVCIFILAAVITSCGGSGGGTADNNDNNTGATLSGTVQPDPNDSTAAGQNSGATVYIVGQQNSAVQTDSNGNFNLPVDATLSGTVLSSPSVNRETAPATNTYGLVVISASNTHGRKTEATVTEGRENNLETVYINTVGAISGKAFLQNAPGNDHTGIRVYIPGTSFQATTNANGNYTISNVPSGTYDLIRADLSGSVYHYAMVARVTVNSGQTTTLPDMLLQTSVGENGKIIINNEAAYTTSKTVELQIAPSANAVLMQISDDINFTGLTWEDVKPTKTFTFSGDFSAGGTGTVYAKFADVSGLTSSPVSAQIYIDTNPLATLVSPVNAGNTASTKPMLDWKYDPPMPSPKYHVEIGTANSCSMTPLEQATDLTASQYTLSTALNNGSTYYWCVAIIDESGHQWSWAGPWSFRVDLGTVNLLSPTNTSIISDTTPTFTWSANTNATSYTHYIEGPHTSPTITTHTTTGTSYAPVSDIGSDGTYTWSVTPVDQFGQSGTTASPYSFILDTIAPAGESIIISGTTGTGIVINNNDILAASLPLVLTLKASDLNGVAAYCVSAQSSCTSWVTVTPATNFTASVDFSDIASGSGSKTVNVWFKDRAGNISSKYSDDIQFIQFATPLILDGEGGGKRVGYSSSIALDNRSPQRVHISYLDHSNQDLLYITNMPGSWITPTVIDTAASNLSGRTSIGVDSLNNVHISYYDQTAGFLDLKYAFVNSTLSSVTTTIVDNGVNVGIRNSLAVDSVDNVHISYYDLDVFGLKYALKSSGTWTIKSVDSAGPEPGTGDANSIAVDTSNTPHISYFHSTSDRIVSAVSDTVFSWITTTVSTGITSQPSATSIAVDSANREHVCYVYSSALYYATNASGTWSVTSIDSNSGSNSNCAIAVNSAGVHIVYGGGTLKYATNAYSGAWAYAVVDSSGGVYAGDIAVDSNGDIHISYVQQDIDLNGSLKYARSQ